jgi:hypothetical protein
MEDRKGELRTARSALMLYPSRGLLSAPGQHQNRGSAQFCNERNRQLSRRLLVYWIQSRSDPMLCEVRYYELAEEGADLEIEILHWAKTGGWRNPHLSAGFGAAGTAIEEDRHRSYLKPGSKKVVRIKNGGGEVSTRSFCPGSVHKPHAGI